MKKTFTNRNVLLTVTLLLLSSYCKEMTGGYETSLSLKCQSLRSLNLFYYPVFGVLRA